MNVVHANNVPISYAKQAMVLIALERRGSDWVPLAALQQETGLNADDVRNVCGYMACLGFVEQAEQLGQTCIRDPYAHIKPSPTVSLNQSAAPRGFTPPTTF